MANTETYGIIGGGNMGEALISGLLAAGLAKDKHILVYDPDPARQEHLRKAYGIRKAAGNVDLVEKASIIILAVKPQMMMDVLAEISTHVRTDQLVISVAAGITLDRLQSAFPIPVPVIRVMPNTPALVKFGATAISPGRHAGADHLERARQIFESVGVAVELDEKYMDIVTGLSGSGPAYVFVFLESLIEAGVRLGLPRAKARILAAQTILGSVSLAIKDEKHPAELRDMVTSPGGTTAAGLFALEENAFRHAVMAAVEAATERSRELGKI